MKIDQIKAAVFDVDGTLLDTMPMWLHISADYLESIGIHTDEDIDRKFLSATIITVAAYMKEKFSIDMTVEEIEKGIVDFAADFYFNKAKMKKGMLEFIGRLKERNIPMMIASSGDRKLIDGAFRRLGIADYFCAVITGDKNGTEVFERCIGILGAKKEETFVFEDGIHAIRTARDMGLKTVAVRDIQDNFPEIEEISDYTMEDFFTQED